MFISAAISPHPPIIIPEVGKENIKEVASTVAAMKKMAAKIAEERPETIIIISPHGLIYPDRMNICVMEKLFGTFANFNAPQVKIEYENDVSLAKLIAHKSLENHIDSISYDSGEESYELDHGTMVPLYYLKSQIPDDTKILPIGYSMLSRAKHFIFGQIIRDIIANDEKNISIIASGDLSHRLIAGAPAGFSETGKKFDRKIIDLLKNQNTKEILELDEEFVEDAGECAYHSILILLGALDNVKHKTEILSYEGPFGVGYLVAYFQKEY
jgi:AmmeMemoRadiSam system protein B